MNVERARKIIETRKADLESLRHGLQKTLANGATWEETLLLRQKSSRVTAEEVDDALSFLVESGYREDVENYARFFMRQSKLFKILEEEFDDDRSTNG